VHFYPFIEKLISLFNRRIIFDFDDAVYLYPSNKEAGRIFNLLWDRKKIERIIKLSKQVIVANNFLRDYVARFTKNVTVIPTSIDLQLYRPAKRLKDPNGQVTIGWIGSLGTFGYLKNIFPVFRELAKRYSIKLKIVGVNGPRIDGIKTCYRGWDINTEIEDISSFDIGVMPLTDDEWSRGKSGTKLIQYMAAGVPAVASPVGINTEIIKDGVNGFLAVNKEDWEEKITALIENRELGTKMARRARADIEKFYSIQANAPKFINVLEEALK
jgi:glycosyltransferase involved in cell wall biosynthesis